MKTWILVPVLLAAGPWHGPLAQTPGAAPQEPRAIQFKPEGSESASLALRAVGGLVVAALLAGGIIYGVRKLAPWTSVPGTRTGKSAVRVIESLRLTQKLTLFVIEFESDRILLAHSDHGLTVLATAPSAGRQNGLRP